MSAKEKMPFINVRGTVAFPGAELTLFIGREASIKTINEVLKRDDQSLVVVTQRKAEQNPPPALNEMFPIGVICIIEKSIKMDDAMKIHCKVEGRVKICALEDHDDIRYATIERMEDFKTLTWNDHDLSIRSKLMTTAVLDSRVDLGAMLKSGAGKAHQENFDNHTMSIDKAVNERQQLLEIMDLTTQTQKIEDYLS